jgi:hypothetical protein
MINSHNLQINGKAELEKPLSFQKDYKLQLVGSVTSMRDKDNEDGTIDRTYSLKLINAQIEDERKGIIKVKDKTREAQKTRGAIYHLQADIGDERPEEEFYNHVQQMIRANLPEIYEKYKN